MPRFTQLVMGSAISESQCIAPHSTSGLTRDIKEHLTSTSQPTLPHGVDAVLIREKELDVAVSRLVLDKPTTSERLCEI